MKKLLLFILFLLLFPVNSFATNYCELSSAKLCWTFEEGSGTTTDDKTSNNNDGTFKGSGEPAWGTGLVDFDGTNDYIYVDSESDLNFIKNGEDFTIVFKIDYSDGGNYERFVNIFNSTDNDGYGIMRNSSDIALIVEINNDQDLASLIAYTDELLANEVWMFVQYDYSEDKLRFQINDTIIKDWASVTTGGSFTWASDNKLYLGGRDNVETSTDSTFSDFALFNEILTETQMDDIYANGLGAVTEPSLTITSVFNDIYFNVPLTSPPSPFTNYCQDANNKGCWGMENSGNESDLSSNGTTLIETSGTIPQDVNHKFGTYSRDFETDDTEYLIASDGGVTDINGADQEISICAWYYPEAAITAHRAIVAKYDSAGNQKQYRLFVNSNAQAMLYLSADGTNYESAYSPSSAVTNGTWNHICGVYNDTDIRVYVNGSLASYGSNNPKTYSSGIFNSSADFMVGAALSGGTLETRADGLIDDVCIFDRELSSAEVLEIYTNGCTGGN